MRIIWYVQTLSINSRRDVAIRALEMEALQNSEQSLLTSLLNVKPTPGTGLLHYHLF